MILLSRKEHFNAAHRLFNPAWSDEKNQEVFGSCANANWHGHNFELIVTLRGTPDPDTGFIFDLKKLSTLIREKIIKKVDHKNLNLDVDFMQGKMASTEIFAQEIFNILKKEIEAINPNVELYKIVLYETPRNFVEIMND